MQIHNFRKILTILINDLCIKIYSLSVVAFTKKRNNDRAASRANTQPSSEYFSVRRLIILILGFL